MNRVLHLLAGLFLLLPLLAGATLEEEKVRPAAVAGSWYPGEAKVLADYLDQLLEQAEPNPNALQGPPLRALIVPHAGYRYSGATAAAAYRLLKGKRYDRVVVLGPAHHSGFRGFSIADVSAYETPLGRIPLDSEAVKRLRSDSLVVSHPQAHRKEHSIEMQLPFLQHVLQPGWKLVPILVGWLEAGDHAKAAALLRPLLDDKTLLVVSTDFTHYGAMYHYLPFPVDEKTPSRIDALDRGAVDRILKRDADGFLDYRQRTGITICGYQAVGVLLELLLPEAEGKVVAHATSGSLSGDYHLSVSYYAIAFRSPRPFNGQDPSADELSDADWRLLHRLAVLGIHDAVSGRSAPKKNPAYQRLLKKIPERLKRPAGAFVTLRKKGSGRLRGCIGYIRPLFPLYQAVYENAFSAARRDPRFPPVSKKELAGLEMDISILSPLKPIESPRKFHVGKEGIVLNKDGRRAVFLPEVATNQGWTREQTLEQLALKAGLPPDAWKAKDARFFVFTTQERHFPTVRPMGGN